VIFQKKDDRIDQELFKIHALIKELESDIKLANLRIIDLEAECSKFKIFRSEALGMHETHVHQVNALAKKMNDREEINREDLELRLTGFVGIINKKLETLGDKRGIVVDLLKRIAFLEGELEKKNVSD
jgi:hypothetical protein